MNNQGIAKSIGEMKKKMECECRGEEGSTSASHPKAKADLEMQRADRSPASRMP